MKQRKEYWLLGVLTILIGVFLPRDWYDAMPTNPEVPPPPLKGITLLQFVCVLEGLVLIWLALKHWTYVRLSEVERLSFTTAYEEFETVRKRPSMWLLLAITLLALSLRVLHLDADFWLDEIRATLDANEMSTLQVVASYLRSNVHLLNTLLMKLSIASFGETEWAIRLPAVIFGTATIPAIYLASRLALSRGASLGAALLLAVSYHHIFFSQNARGYTAYLFFSLLSSVLLVQGLQKDRARTWVLYILTMVLNFASLLISAFVFASHILVGAIALCLVMNRGTSPLPLFRRLTVIFGITAILFLQLYALILPQFIAYVFAGYSSPASGYAPLSGEFLREMIRGLSAGFGPGMILGVLPFLMLAGTGFVVLFRRQWTLIVALTLPLILTAAFLIVNHLTVSPRFFLLALPVAILTAVEGINSLASLVGRKLGKRQDFSHGLATTIVLVVCAMSLVSLRYYYSVPKQAYRASLKYLETQRQPGEIIIVIHIAERGYRYYGKRFGLSEGRDYFFVRSEEALDAVLSSHGENGKFIVTTFSRALHLRHPNLEARIAKDWVIARTFPGTIGNGEISVWKQRHL